MNAELLFATGMMRFIVYGIVGVMSVACLRHKDCPDRILHIGDLIFCIVSAFSFLSQNILSLPIGTASVYIFTPAFFIWGLSRIIYFNKNHGKSI
jgi:multidrug transporter EmrE-like cation transporter